MEPAYHPCRRPSRRRTGHVAVSLTPDGGRRNADKRVYRRRYHPTPDKESEPDHWKLPLTCSAATPLAAFSPADSPFGAKPFLTKEACSSRRDALVAFYSGTPASGEGPRAKPAWTGPNLRRPKWEVLDGGFWTEPRGASAVINAGQLPASLPWCGGASADARRSE
jgi:hypothetical protein